MSGLTIRNGETLRVPLQFWQDGPPEARLEIDSVDIWAHDLPISVSILPPNAPAPAPDPNDGYLFLDATGPEGAELVSGKLYSIEIKAVASLDHKRWPVIGVEVPR